MCFFYLKYGNAQRSMHCIDCSNTNLLGHLFHKHIPLLHAFVDEWSARVAKDLALLDKMEERGGADEGAAGAGGAGIPGGDAATRSVKGSAGGSAEGSAGGSAEGTEGESRVAAALVQLRALRVEQRDALLEAKSKLRDIVSVCLTKSTGEVVLDGTKGATSVRARDSLVAKETYILTGQRRQAGGGADDADAGGKATGKGKGQGHAQGEISLEQTPLVFAIPPDDGPTIASILSARTTRGGPSSGKPGGAGHRRVVSERPAAGDFEGDFEGGGFEGGFDDKENEGFGARHGGKNGKRPGHHRSQTDGGAVLGHR